MCHVNCVTSFTPTHVASFQAEHGCYLFFSKSGVMNGPTHQCRHQLSWFPRNVKFICDISKRNITVIKYYQADENQPDSPGAWVGMIVGRENSPSTFR